MEEVPKVGDVWVYEETGELAPVTEVSPPLHDGGEWLIRLGCHSCGPTHIGWWIGQGWAPQD